MRELLSSTAWVDRTSDFARELRRSTAGGDALLLVGTPTDEPWHLAAHLDEESRYAELPQLSPTLVRWSAPADAPPHLAVTLARLEAARAGDTVFVVAPDDPTTPLLERVDDARRTGAVVLSLDSGDADLADLAHERIVVPRRGLLTPAEEQRIFTGDALTRLGEPTTADELIDAELSFETVQHLVSVAAGDTDLRVTPTAGRGGFRSRLGRLLDRISGPEERPDW